MSVIIFTDSFGEKMKVHEKTFVPRLPEAGQKRLKSGGAHRNKNAYHRSAEKRNFERQVKDFK